MESHDVQSVAAALSAFTNTPNPDAAAAVLTEHAQILLSSEAIRILDHNLACYPDPVDQGILGLRRRAITYARDHGLEAGIAELYQPGAALRRAIEAYVHAPDRPSMIEHLRSDARLLSDEAVEIFERVVADNTGPEVAERLEFVQWLVLLARESGVEGAREHVRNQLIDAILRDPRNDADKVAPWWEVLQLTDTEKEQDLAAQIEMSLGQAYRARANRGDQTDLDHAIEHLKSALEYFTPERNARHFAGANRVLGNIYVNDERLERHARLNLALHHYEKALTRTFADREPAQFLHLNFMIANCLQELGRPSDGRMFLRAALTAVEGAGLSQAIDTCSELVNQLRGGGAEVVDALDEALVKLSARVEKLPSRPDGGESASANYSLAKVYAKVLGPHRRDYMERALAHMKAALQLRPREADPDRWARTQHDLGTFYFQRIAHERSDNIEQAIEHYQNALTVHTREAFPQFWALTHNALGIAWLERVKGSEDRNTRTGAELLATALSIWNERDNGFLWAESTNALGAANLRLGQHGDAAALTAAIECFESAGRVFTKERYPERWAPLVSNLAAAYSERGAAPDSERAEILLREAVDTLDRANEGHLWAVLARNLAALIGTAAMNRDASRFPEAIALLHNVLDVFDAQCYPAEHRDAQADLGRLRLAQDSWSGALAAYRAAIAAAERVFRGAFTETGRLHEAQKLATIYRDAAYCLVRLGEPAEALSLQDRGKTRVLTDAVELSEARFEELPEAHRSAAVAAREELARAEDEMRKPEGAPGRRSDAVIGRAIQQAREALANALGAAPTPQAPLTTSDILKVIPKGGALVAPLLTEKGGVAFVVPASATTINADHVVSLPIGSSEANALLRGSVERPGLLRAYADFLNAHARGDPEAADRALNRYLLKVDTVCLELWRALQPIYENLEAHRLERGAPVLMVPHGPLALLPLHAAIANGRPAFLERYAPYYSPSMALQEQSLARVRDRCESRLFAVADPVGDLEFAGLECAELMRLFGPRDCDALFGAQATVEAVISGCGGASHLHFSCHGFYAWWDVLRSGLVLAGNRVLDAAEIMSPRVDLNAARLVTLSACETGLSEYERYPDEYVGLNASLLLAGAPAVVSTLWAVEQRSTALLMAEFYRLLLAGEGIAAALAGAQRWLSELTLAGLSEWLDERSESYRAADAPEQVRKMAAVAGEWAGKLRDMRDVDAQSRPYAHPYYWAAFSALGAAAV
jgi:CHAT domain-containing protein/tetratricopeptide (TPR) repeat protein